MSAPSAAPKASSGGGGSAPAGLTGGVSALVAVAIVAILFGM